MNVRPRRAGCTWTPPFMLMPQPHCAQIFGKAVRIQKAQRHVSVGVTSGAVPVVHNPSRRVRVFLGEAAKYEGCAPWRHVRKQLRPRDGGNGCLRRWVHWLGCDDNARGVAWTREAGVATVARGGRWLRSGEYQFMCAAETTERPTWLASKCCGGEARAPKGEGR